jgi:hypothetical protein
MNARNVIVLAGVAVAALIILGLVSTILNAIVPLTIVAVVAFILGRMSTRMNLFQAGMNLASRATKRAEAPQAAANPATQQEAPVTEKSKPLPQTRTLPQTDKLDETKITLSDEDFKVKSSEDILAESKRLEDEVAKRSATYDPAAALEERKRRLLGDQKDESST